MSDESLLHCPVVEAPLVTELKEGFIVLEFTVHPDGSVDDIRVLDEGGDPRWSSAAIETLARWKFKPSDRSVRKTHRFTFEFEK